MSDTPAAAAKKPAATKMPRAVHELQTGPRPEQKINAGTLIDDEIAKAHKLDAKTIASLVATGALEEVEVLKG